MVTGGGGFIGSNLVEALVKLKHDVVVVDDFSSGCRKNLEGLSAVKIVEADIRDKLTIEQAADGCEVFFHLAASVGNKRSIDDPCHDAGVNVIGSLNVLEAARVQNAKAVVASSSAGVYGELRTIPITEEHVLDPDTPYGSSKLCMEKNFIAYDKLYGMKTICLRYFNVYGKHQRFDEYGNVIPIFAQQLFNNQAITIFGDGEQTRDFVNVQDVVQANLKAAFQAEKSGVFNIGSASRITINRLAELLEQGFDRKQNRVYAEKRPGDVLHSLAETKAALDSFGFAPTVEIERGIDEYVKWYCDENS